MVVALITGAARGIGLELVRRCAMHYRVVATCRKASDELRAIKKIQIVEGVDIREFKVPEGIERVDLLINNAGIYPREHTDEKAMLEAFEVNALGSLHVAETVLPLIPDRGKMVFISTRVASIEDNASGSRYAYRMSKTALNMGVRDLAKRFAPKNIAVGILHPGHVSTDMTSNKGSISVSESVDGLMKQMALLSMERSGRFFHANGEELPW